MTNLLSAFWTVVKFIFFALGVLLGVALCGKNSRAVKDALNESGVPLVKF